MAQALRGTVTDFPGFDERADAETLRKAMKGLGTDEESILTLLTARSNAQRQEIVAAFKTLFGRDLLDDLKSELTGKFEKLIVALMKPSWLYDAYELKHALKGAGTDEKVLTEIIASRTPEELTAIKNIYEEEYGSSLEDDVVGDTSGFYQRMLVVLLQANRDPDAGINEAQVEQDAQTLFQAGELKWGTDEEKFITIFGTRSVSHLRRVFDKYMTISGFQIEEATRCLTPARRPCPHAHGPRVSQTQAGTGLLAHPSSLTPLKPLPHSDQSCLPRVPGRGGRTGRPAASWEPGGSSAAGPPSDTWESCGAFRGSAQ
uniref:Annexin n=1 Tax=Myotis myotis TaxID=51298 RepID=A0A7J7XEK8_MYOMY|nr:annexin A5 [Myotis myotis]